MPDQYLINPLLNPIFVPTIFRTLVILIVGLIVIMLIEKFNWQQFKLSNLGQRYIGWLILTPIYLLGVFLGGLPALIVLFAFIYLAVYELTSLAKLPKIYFWTLIVLAVWSIIVASRFSNYFYSLPLLYFIVITMVTIRGNDGKRGLQHASTSLFISIWIIFSLCHAILLGHLNNTIDNSKSLLIMIIFATSFSDIGAYMLGKLFHKLNLLDKYKIAANISPNKTYIGILGHVLGAGAGIWLMYFILGKYLDPFNWLIVAVLIGVFGLVGGLTNSLFKRFYKTKDSSQLIPGHGGVMDRIDSMSRVVVILYYYFLLTLK